MLNLLIGLGGILCGVGVAFFFDMDNRIKRRKSCRRSWVCIDGASFRIDRRAHGRPAHQWQRAGELPKRSRASRTCCSRCRWRSLGGRDTGGRRQNHSGVQLALGMAMAGQRVLLIDADMRRPRVHEAIQHEPGLSTFSWGRESNEVMRQTALPNFYVLPAGKIPPNPAELLGSKRFAELLNSLKDHFDLVVIDTPPVMAVTDAAVIGYRASGVLFVAAADVTNRNATQARSMARART
jgi:capsular exopolysaccharide synthesis family protein